MYALNALYCLLTAEKERQGEPDIVSCHEVEDLLYFFNAISDWFSTCNGTIEFENEEQIVVLRKMEEIARNMTFFDKFVGFYNDKTVSDSTHVVPVKTVTTKNLVTTIRSFRNISSMLAKNFAITKFEGRHLNQDIIENYFGLMKGLCGSNDTPTCYTYSGNSLALLLCDPLNLRLRGANCQWEGGIESLLSLEEFLDAQQGTDVHPQPERPAFQHEVCGLHDGELGSGFNIRSIGENVLRQLFSTKRGKESKTTECTSVNQNHEEDRRDEMVESEAQDVSTNCPTCRANVSSDSFFTSVESIALL